MAKSDPASKRPRKSRGDGDAVLRFAREMLEKLRVNRHKQHWSGFSDAWLFNRLKQEMGELRLALTRKRPDAEVIAECADVANFAMMIADRRLENSDQDPR